MHVVPALFTYCFLMYCSKQYSNILLYKSLLYTEHGYTPYIESDNLLSLYNYYNTSYIQTRDHLDRSKIQCRVHE